MPSAAPSSASEWYTLLPSPTKATVRPRTSPNRSCIVNTSARAWHGCSRRVRPLMTGIAGLRGELDDDLVRSGAHHDGIDEPLEVAGHVAHGLAGAQDDIVGQVEGMPAELRHAGLEGDARAQARLLEQHRQRPPDQRHRGVPPRLAILRLQRRPPSRRRRRPHRPTDPRRSADPARRSVPSLVVMRSPCTSAGTQSGQAKPGRDLQATWVQQGAPH